MRNLRPLTFSLAVAVLAGSAAAQFDGPAPLAWRWTQPTTTPPAGAPVVSGDDVFVAVGNRLFALERESGNLKWRFPQIDPIDGVFRSAPVLVEGTLVAIGTNRMAYGVDPATGQSKWQINLPDTPFGQPVTTGRYAIVQLGSNRLFAIDTVAGTPFWEAPITVPEGISGGIGVYRNSVLLFTNRNELRSISIVTRNVEWARRFTQVPANAQPVVHGDTIFAITGPFLASLNAASGLPRWQRNTGNAQLAFRPAVSSDAIFVASRDGRGYAFDLQGQPLNKEPIMLGSAPIVPASGVGTHFAVATANGAINLVDPRSGEVVWSFLKRPIAEMAAATAASGGGGGEGMMMGGGGGGASAAAAQRQFTVQASGPAVVAGQTLLVPTLDGSLLAFDRELGVDLTPPRVNMLWPFPADPISGQPPLELIFRITDEASGINENKLQILLDDQPLEFQFGRDGHAIVRISVAGPNRPLSDGTRNVTVRVSDWMGNETKQTYRLVIDNSLRPLQRPGATTPPAGGAGGGAGGRGSDR
jgi:outer membrane protein assembly factor BamB